MTDFFAGIRFAGRLRPSQQDAIEIARRQLAAGERRLHIVAPPGSGKTVLGLYLWAECIRRPAVVLSPNSAIQAQWAARTGLFGTNGSRDPLISTDPQSPGLLTSLTYQSVTLPRRGGEDLDAQAVELWVDTLIEKGQADNPDEATVWIDDLKQHNLEYYEERLAAYRKQVRDAAAMQGGSLEMLHASSRATLERLRRQDIGLIILDECHHLMGHWGRVLADAYEFLAQPIVVGLTATPPDRSDKSPEDIQRYDTFFGPVDYEVPVPAVVKDGFLAPYQDLAYFVQPTSAELAFIAGADDQLHRIVEDLCRPESSPAGEHVCEEPLPDWLLRVLTERRLPTGVVKDWTSFERRDPDFAFAARSFLQQRGLELPTGVPKPAANTVRADVPEMAVLVPVLDRYIRHRLRRSENAADHELAEQAIWRLRTLGVQITETGSQPCASPVGRVMAYSRAKTESLLPILQAERQKLGDRLRAVVISDYEKTSAVTAEVAHLLDSEAGGAIAAFKALLSHPETDALDPVLVTGSSVLVDDDLAPRLVERAEAWLAEHGYVVALTLDHEDGFRILNGQGADWCPRVYVALITDLFQQGVTRCLVGTRGLLGEGWDANTVNVLIDLTTVTTSMSVNQLRGRSIRLDPGDPQKLADNWDVVCLAPEFSKGLDDYQRFIRKHKTIFGVTDDGAIEKGVGHVHAAFTELKPEGVEGTAAVLNSDMLARTDRRAEVRRLWRIGEPYHPEPIRTVELRPLGGESPGFPPFAGAETQWSANSLALAIGRALLGSLAEAGLIKTKLDLQVGDRAGGYVRVFLKEASKKDSALFTEALREAMGPLDRPRYVIPRVVDHFDETWLSNLLPVVVGRYFRRRRREMTMLHAVPSLLAKNKRSVAVYQRHWNAHVSPGVALYAYQGEGARLLERARRDGLTPGSEIHEKEVFL